MELSEEQKAKLQAELDKIDAQGKGCIRTYVGCIGIPLTLFVLVLALFLLAKFLGS